MTMKILKANIFFDRKCPRTMTRRCCELALSARSPLLRGGGIHAPNFNRPINAITGTNWEGEGVKAGVQSEMEASYA
jgi:hypothetical protein